VPKHFPNAETGHEPEAKPELLTVQDFLKRYSISRTTFYRLLNAGELKAVRVRRRTMIARADAESWLASLPAATCKAA